MYDLRIKNDKITLRGADAKDKELVYDNNNNNPRIHVIMPTEGIYVDTKWDLDTVYLNDDGYIKLYDCIDNYTVDIHVDPDLYYLEADYIDDLEIMTLRIVKKEGSVVD